MQESNNNFSLYLAYNSNQQRWHLYLQNTKSVEFTIRTTFVERTKRSLLPQEYLKERIPTQYYWFQENKKGKTLQYQVHRSVYWWCAINRNQIIGPLLVLLPRISAHY